MKAVRAHEPGSVGVLRYEDVPAPVPREGEALVKLEAIGVNFVDTYIRRGFYQASFPLTLGQEGAGTVVDVGPNVSEVKIGDRVASADMQGSYAECAITPASRLVKLPEGLSSSTGAAAMLQGMTAHFLSHSAYPLKIGDTALIHAAAGGVGLLLVQMAKRLSARVIGTVSTQAKATLAKEAGADEVILYTQQDFEAEVRRITNGRGVNVVYDSIGQATFEKSLNCLAPRGYMILFGQSSGFVPRIDLMQLAWKGSLFLTRPMLEHYTLSRRELLEHAGDVFDSIQSGDLRVRIEQTFRLHQAAEAHRLLENRLTTAKLLLLP